MKIAWGPIHGIVPEADHDRNVLASATLGLPDVGALRHVAVVGGGPSIAEHVAEIAAWPGPVWAINGAAEWCAKRGIDATMFVVDPHPDMAQFATRHVRRAILSGACDASLFEALARRGVRVWRFEWTAAGTCAASIAPLIAVRYAGAERVTLFGCEGSFQSLAGHHAYRTRDDYRNLMLVRCGGKLFLTRPQLFIQVLEIAPVIRQLAPHVEERSAGFLRAMAQNDCDYDVEWVSSDLAAAMTYPEAA